MAVFAVIESDSNGGFSIKPATQADIDAVIVPSVSAQIDDKIVASEQRTWQRMADADTNTATNVETSLFAKIKAALQAALNYLG
jgi:hypothetical protein